jgi:hypothetical protein
MRLRITFIRETFVDYLKDILFWRVDAFSFKTAEFVKRNFNKLRSTLSHLMYELRKVKLGFVRLKQDMLFYLGLKKKKINLKYS